MITPLAGRGYSCTTRSAYGGLAYKDFKTNCVINNRRSYASWGSTQGRLVRDRYGVGTTGRRTRSGCYYGRCGKGVPYSSSLCGRVSTTSSGYGDTNFASYTTIDARGGHRNIDLTTQGEYND